MGSDLLIAAMAAPYREGQDYWQIPDADIERIGHARIAAYDLTAWTDDDLHAFVEDFIPDVWQEDVPSTEPERARWREQVRETLHYALAELLGGRRDVACLLFGGRPYWLTGGMSWGDTPTDAFEWIAALEHIALFDEPL